MNFSAHPHKSSSKSEWKILSLNGLFSMKNTENPDVLINILEILQA